MRNKLKPTWKCSVVLPVGDATLPLYEFWLPIEINRAAERVAWAQACRGASTIAFAAKAADDFTAKRNREVWIVQMQIEVIHLPGDAMGLSEASENFLFRCIDRNATKCKLRVRDARLVGEGCGRERQ